MGQFRTCGERPGPALRTVWNGEKSRVDLIGERDVTVVLFKAFELVLRRDQVGRTDK